MKVCSVQAMGSALAIGIYGNPETCRSTAAGVSRTRKPIDKFVFSGSWNRPHHGLVAKIKAKKADTSAWSHSDNHFSAQVAAMASNIGAWMQENVGGCG